MLYSEAIDRQDTPSPATKPDDATPLGRLRAYLGTLEIGPDARLPPERELCAEIGISRGQLRLALAKLEAEGLIWRHVGKGTFIGVRPIENAVDITAIARRTNPLEVMKARLLLEPELAAVAAINATQNDLAELRACLERNRAAKNKHEYDTWNVRFHRMIAASTHNQLLLSIMDILVSVRREVKWGELRSGNKPLAKDHYSFDQHDRIVQAIENRDAAGARAAMAHHLKTVREKLRRHGAPWA